MRSSRRPASRKIASVEVGCVEILQCSTSLALERRGPQERTLVKPERIGEAPVTSPQIRLIE